MEGFRLYSSYQDAVGIDGEAIEFEWKFPKIFIIVYSLKNSTRLGDVENAARGGRGPDHLHMTLSGTRVIRIVFRVPKKSGITQ